MFGLRTGAVAYLGCVPGRGGAGPGVHRSGFPVHNVALHAWCGRVLEEVECFNIFAVIWVLAFFNTHSLISQMQLIHKPLYPDLLRQIGHDGVDTGISLQNVLLETDGSAEILHFK